VKRGFKTWCERVSEDYRSDLGLAQSDPLSSHELAKHLGIKVRKPSDFSDISQWALDQLLRHDSSGWSAVTICFEGKGELIILNSSHPAVRQNSSLMHELAHLLIGHSAARADISRDGCLLLNSYDKEQEDEANWFAGALLLPRSAALNIVVERMDSNVAADRYGISTKMLKWRLDATGVRRQFERRQSLGFG